MFYDYNVYNCKICSSLHIGPTTFKRKKNYGLKKVDKVTHINYTNNKGLKFKYIYLQIE